MNRRIGKLITVGLFAALSLAWPVSARADDPNPPSDTANPAATGTLEGNTKDGINPVAPMTDNPIDTTDTRTPAQQKAGDLDHMAPPPGSAPSATPDTSDHTTGDHKQPERQLRRDDSSGANRLDNVRPQSLDAPDTSDPVRTRNPRN